MSGGTLTTSGAGLIEIASGSSATVGGASQGALTRQASYNTSLQLGGTLDNQGALSLQSAGDANYLLIDNGTLPGRSIFKATNRACR